MLLLRFVNTEIPNAVRCGARQKNDAACRTMPQLNAPYPVWTNLLSLYFWSRDLQSVPASHHLIG